MRLYNTLSGGTETFTPDDDIVKMYVCGVTPYSASHVGHAMRAVVFDVIRRYLEFSGHSVKHVENFTDIALPRPRIAVAFPEGGTEPTPFNPVPTECFTSTVDMLDWADPGKSLADTEMEREK